MSRLDAAKGAVVIRVNGVELTVARGSSVAAALVNARVPSRHSVGGEPRAALCGMGVCHECRVAIDGVAHRRGCLVVVAPGMEVRTNG
jgi:D-hydroxyproline dehydrogenase subunit gamma